jgi:short-subunit dehydrogenase
MSLFGVINNAGAGFYQPSWEMPMDEVRYLMDLNFFAPLALTQLAVPHMRERRSTAGTCFRSPRIASRRSI